MIKKTLSNTKLLLSVFSGLYDPEETRVNQLNCIAIHSGFDGWNHLRKCLNSADFKRFDDIAKETIEDSHKNSLFPLGGDLKDPLMMHMSYFLNPRLSHRANKLFKILNLFAYVCYSGVFRNTRDTISLYPEVASASKSMLKGFNLNHLSDIELLCQFDNIFRAGDVLTKAMHDLSELDHLQTLGELLKLEQYLFGDMEAGMVIAKKMALILKEKLDEEGEDWPYNSFINDGLIWLCFPPEHKHNYLQRFDHVIISLTKDGKVLLPKIDFGCYTELEIKNHEMMEEFFKKHDQVIEAPIRETLEEYKDYFL